MVFHFFFKWEGINLVNKNDYGVCVLYEAGQKGLETWLLSNKTGPKGICLCLLERMQLGFPYNVTFQMVPRPLVLPSSRCG